MGRVEQQGLQGNILCGYGNAFAYGLYACFRVNDETAGRALLDGLLREGPGITNAVPWPSKPAETRNVGFTLAGLRALGVSQDALDAFPAHFREGMAAKAGFLGDTGESAPEKWDAGLRPGEMHILVTVTTQEEALRDSRLEWLRELERASAGGLELVHELKTGLLDHPGDDITFSREHFGFADGVSQPSIADRKAGPYKRRGKGTPRRIGWNDVAPGEFILGYEDEEGIVSGATLPRKLVRNGSYMVVRKLAQDVAGFEGFLDQHSGGSEQRELLAAKMVGRWRSGAPLALAPQQDDLRLTAGGEKAKRMNAFRYGKDQQGLRCPVGSHVRRANPRDALGWQGRLTKRHRIIRRGMAYGPRPADPRVPDDIDRGLMFVCFQANIERQFEVIQGHWMNDGDVFGLGADRDFLCWGQGAGGKLAVPAREGPPTLLPDRQSFVTTRGGDYFFVPGLRALTLLARGESLS